MNTEDFLKIVKKEGVDNHPLLCELYLKHKDKDNDKTEVQEQLEYLFNYFDGDKKAVFALLGITTVWGYNLTKGYSCSRKMKKIINEKYLFILKTKEND